MCLALLHLQDTPNAANLESETKGGKSVLMTYGSRERGHEYESRFRWHSQQRGDAPLEMLKVS